MSRWVEFSRSLSPEGKVISFFKWKHRAAAIFEIQLFHVRTGYAWSIDVNKTITDIAIRGLRSYNALGYEYTEILWVEIAGCELRETERGNSF